MCKSTADPADAVDTLYLEDSGSNTAKFTANVGGVTKQGTLSLASPDNLLYGKQCVALWMSSVNITLKWNDATAVFNPNNINTWLAKLGLENVVVLTGSGRCPTCLTCLVSAAWGT